MDTKSYALSKKYTNLVAVGLTSATVDDVNKSITFTLAADGSQHTIHFDQPKDGVSITNISIDANNNLVCTMSDGTEQKAKINILDNVYTKTETDTLLLDKAEKNHNHDSAYASKDKEHEHSNKETLDKFGVNDGGKLTFNGDVVTPEASDLSDYLKKTDAQNTYVAQETGKGLSENDFTTVLKEAYDKAVEDSHTHTNKSVIDKFSEGSDGALLYDGQSIEADLSTVYKKTETYSQTESDDKFVAKESGKGLSANDLTNDLKSSYDDAVTAKHTHENGTVLDGITAEKVEAWDKAEENVQSDWNETDDTADGFIKNKPTIPDAYDDTALSGRVDDVETSIGDMSLIEVKSVSDLVSAINALYNSFMSGITYADKKLTISYRNGGSTIVDISSIVTDTKLTELSDVDDTGITDKQVLSYDTATSKYIPTTIDTAGVLADAKKYTDDEIAKINNADAMAVDEKPTYSDGTITYKKDGVENTITDGDFWFFYTVDGMAYQTIWIDGVEFTTSVDGSVDFKDFVSKTNDLTSTYTGEETDKTKVTTISALDALYAIISTALGKKVNTTDIVDNLSSDSTDKPLSAAQGKALDTKISDLATTVEEDYAKKTDLHSHTNKTVLDGITEEKVTAWDKAQENIIESVKVNDQEITPDENKAVNIDLSNYTEHDEIIGENLIPFPYSDGMSKTMNGIEYTVNPDGSVTAVGTATETSAFVLAKYLNIDPNTTYILSGDLDNEITYKSSAILFNAETNSGTSYWNYGKDEPVIFTGISVLANFRIRVTKDETVNQTFYPMLEIGNIPHKYQQYKLSRNNLREDIDELKKLDDKLENQFNIASGDYITLTDSVDGNIVELGVKGNSEQKQLQGYNLIPFPYYSESGKSSGGLTFTYGDDFNITVNGTISSSYAGFAIARNIKVDAVNKKYMLIGLPTTGSGTTHKLRVRYIFPDGTTSDFTNCYNVNGDILDKKDSTYEGATMEIDLMCYDDKDNFQVRPMLVEVAEDGSYPTEYEAYCGGVPSPSPSYPQEIKSVGDDGSLVVKSRGKNLIPYPYDDGVRTNVGLTMTSLPNGMVNVNGTNTGVSGLFNFNYPTRSLIKLDPSKTYAFFNPLKTDVKNQITLGIRWYLEGQEISVQTGTNTSIAAHGNSNGAVIRSGFSYAYVYLYGYNSGKTFNNVLFAPMLVEVNEDGTYPTEYEIYKSSTTTIPLSEPLRAIGDVKDEITYQDGKWGVLRRTGQYVIDGTESWLLDSGNITEYGISIRLPNYTNIFNGIKIVSGNHFDMITDYLRCREFTFSPIYSASSKYDFGSGIYRTGNNIWIAFGASDIEKMEITKDLDSAKTWLSSHNITVHYPLGTPVFEPFADQTLPYLSTYDGVTNISNDDALFAEMTVKYPTTDASGVGSRNESRIAELAKDTDDKFDDVKESLGTLEFGEIAGGKNLIPYPYSHKSGNYNGVEITINDDYSISLNGTNTGERSDFGFAGISRISDMPYMVSLKEGKSYTLSLEFFSGSLPDTSEVIINGWNDDSVVKLLANCNSKNNVYTFTVPEDSGIKYGCIYLQNRSGLVFDNVRLRPMLTEGNKVVPYERYVPSVKMLADEVKAQKNDLGGLTFSASGTTLSITDGTNTWTLEANS